MSRYSKELRQQIVEDFARRHNGQYDPALFLKEVRETGPEHQAYDWFEWDQSKAATEHNLWQARCFAKDLRISFTIEEVGRNTAMKVKEVEMPMVLSPSASRRNGGGYVLVDPNDPAHMAEHCHQAAAALRSWLKRYESALVHAGSTANAVEKIAKLMDEVKPLHIEAAE